MPIVSEGGIHKQKKGLSRSYINAKKVVWGVFPVPEMRAKRQTPRDLYLIKSHVVSRTVYIQAHRDLYRDHVVQVEAPTPGRVPHPRGHVGSRARWRAARSALGCAQPPAHSARDTRGRAASAFDEYFTYAAMTTRETKCSRRSHSLERVVHLDGWVRSTALRQRSRPRSASPHRPNEAKRGPRRGCPM